MLVWGIKKSFWAIWAVETSLYLDGKHSQEGNAMSVPTDLQVLVASRKWVEAYGKHHLNHNETVLAKMALAVLVLTPTTLTWLAINDRQALKQVMTALFANSWEEYLEEDGFVITDIHRQAISDVMGYTVDDEDIEGYLIFYSGWLTRALEVSLENLERQFAAPGGHKRKISEEIDAMRIVLTHRSVEVPRT